MTLEIGTAENIRKRLLSAIHLTDEDQGRLKTLIEYLEEPKNIEVHKKYLRKLRECPKTLIVFSSTGFRGYLEKHWKFFPYEEEAFKNKHPWLYAKIKESFN
jgi:plasmid stabilization system protein ParE